MTDDEMKAASPHAVLEESGTAFDPSTQHLDLNKEEKRRTTALLMAVNAYQHLIIKSADYLREVADIARRGDGPKIRRSLCPRQGRLTPSGTESEMSETAHADWTITPMLKAYFGDEVSCRPSEADFFRVYCGRSWLGDHASEQSARTAIARATGK